MGLGAIGGISVSTAPAGGRRSLSPTDAAVLAACVALAAFFRLDDLRQPLVDAFSWRQASTAMMADNFRLGGWNIFYPAVSWSGNDPGYQGREFQIVSFITAILHEIFGWHDWLGRLVAVAFGLWTVVALHRLTARLWGTPHAHAAALIYALMPGAIQIDRSFLPDPAMLALVTTGLWLFVHALQEGRAALLPVAGVFLTLGILAKLPGIAAGVPLAFLCVVWFLRGRWATSLALAATGAACLALVIAYYAWAIHLGTTYPPYHVAGSGYIWEEGFRSFFSNRFFLGRAWSIASSWYLSWPLILLVMAGLLHLPPAGGPDDDPALRWLFHVWLAAAGLVFLLAGREITNNPWNLHVFSAPLAAFAGRGLLLASSAVATSTGSIGTGVRAGCIAAFVAAAATHPAVSMMKYPYAESARLLGRQLERLSVPGDLVVAVSRDVGDPIAIYYSRRRGWVFPPANSGHDWSRMQEHDEALRSLERYLELGARWFGIDRESRDSDGRYFVEHHAELLAHLDRIGDRVVDTPEAIVFRLPGD